MILEPRLTREPLKLRFKSLSFLILLLFVNKFIKTLLFLLLFVHKIIKTQKEFEPPTKITSSGIRAGCLATAREGASGVQIVIFLVLWKANIQGYVVSKFQRNQISNEATANANIGCKFLQYRFRKISFFVPVCFALFSFLYWSFKVIFFSKLDGFLSNFHL